MAADRGGDGRRHAPRPGRRRRSDGPVRPPGQRRAPPGAVRLALAAPRPTAARSSRRHAMARCARPQRRTGAHGSRPACLPGFDGRDPLDAHHVWAARAGTRMVAVAPGNAVSGRPPFPTRACSTLRCSIPHRPSRAWRRWPTNCRQARPPSSGPANTWPSASTARGESNRPAKKEERSNIGPAPSYLLSCLPPLAAAARRCERADWQAAVDRAVDHARRSFDLTHWSAPLPQFAAAVEALLPLGCRDLAGEALHWPAALQRRDGSVPFTPRLSLGIERRHGASGGRLVQAGRSGVRRPHHDLPAPTTTCRRRVSRRVGPWRQSSSPRRIGLGRETLSGRRATPSAGGLRRRAEFAARGNFSARRPVGGRLQLVGRLGLAGGCGRRRLRIGPVLATVGAAVSGSQVQRHRRLAALPGTIAGVCRRASRRHAAAAGRRWRIRRRHGHRVPGALVAARAPPCGELCRIVRPGGRVLVIDKHRSKQPLSEHEPWEQWFSPGEVAAWMAPYCQEISVMEIPHGQAHWPTGLFLCWQGRRKAAASR